MNHELYTMRILLLTTLLLFHCALLAQMPTDYAGLQMWVKADAGVIVNGAMQVEMWTDQSGNNQELVQNSNALKPLLIENELNGLPVIRFDGADDRMNFAELTNIRTVFWVIKEDADAADDRVPLLCHSVLFDFHREVDHKIWHPLFSNQFIRDGATKINAAEVNGAETPLPSEFSLVSLVTDGNVSANRFSFDRTFGDRIWDGDLAELIIYDQPLSPEEVTAIENYLFEKYTPEFALTQDTEIPYGVCETELFAADGFETYLWSTGDETSSVLVNESGSYWVEVTDIFGRSLVDTVEVTYPGNLAPPEVNGICFGDSVLWDTGLEGESYVFDWGNENESAQSWFTAAGTYELTITDDNGCAYTSALFEVEMDDFSLNTTLGADVELCAGNTIALLGEGVLEETILWQDETLSPTFVLSETGNYWVEAQNENGCLAQDTILVTVIGTAPEVVILPPAVVCQNTNQTFNGSAGGDSPIVAWNWTFPDETTQNGQVVEYTSTGFGLQNFSCEVVLQSGCSTTAQVQLQVYPSPSGNIINTQACEGNPILFSTTPQIIEGSIFGVDWSFQGETSEGVWAEFIPQTAGFEEVSLTFTSNAGCTSTLSQLINVAPSPIIDLTVPTTCLGELTLPELTVDINGTGGIATYAWFFGDNTSSSQPSPQHLYAAAENYPIELEVTAVNGCYALATAGAEVIAPPFAAFSVSNACVNTAFALVSTGENGSDPVESWIWEVEEVGTFEGEVSEVTFPSAEFFQVTLTVTSENGCQDQQSLQIPVFALPEPDFSFDPAIGLPPLDVTFVNLTPSAETYLWNFGDAQSSTQFAPVHTYLDEGMLAISLQATNIYGCIGTSEQEISLIEPRLDLSIEQLYLEETPFGIRTTIAVVNFGNYFVELASVRLQQGNGTPVGEELLLNIMPGASAIYTLTSRVQSTDQTDAYVCAEIDAVSSLAVEEMPENNQLCAGLIAPFEVAAVFPNPATSGGTINLRVVTPTSEMVVVSIYNAQGKKVVETISTEIGIGFTNLEIALPDLQAGVYTIEFLGEQNQLVQTLLVD